MRIMIEFGFSVAKMPIQIRDTPESKSPINAIVFTPTFSESFPANSWSPSAGIAIQARSI